MDNMWYNEFLFCYLLKIQDRNKSKTQLLLFTKLSSVIVEDGVLAGW